MSLLIGGATILVFEAEIRLGMAPDEARTLAVNTLVIAQAFYLFNSRFITASSLHLGRLFSNKAAWIAVAILLVLQIGFVYLPIMNLWFSTTPLGLRHWLIPLAVGLAVFFLMELEKFATRHLHLKT